MSSRFAPTDPVPVTEAGEINPASVTPDMDVIYIRPRMDFGTKNRVQARALAVAAADPRAGRVDVGSYQIALATENIVGWQGPGFEGKPCNAKMIAALDPDDTLLKAALQAIGERNRERPDPKRSAPSTTAGAASSAGTPL